MKLKEVESRHAGIRAWSLWCPACQERHVFTEAWKFDGNMESPTLKSSIKVTGWISDRCGVGVCHFMLTAGMMIFQNDCTHDMKGKTVPLPEIPQE